MYQTPTVRENNGHGLHIQFTLLCSTGPGDNFYSTAKAVASLFFVDNPIL